MRETSWNDIIGAWLLVALCSILVVIFLYTQRYVKNGYTNTAKQGIIFTRTIDLDQYKTIGEGSGLFGEYTLVTRSVIQGRDEATTVYEDK